MYWKVKGLQVDVGNVDYRLILIDFFTDTD